MDNASRCLACGIYASLDTVVMGWTGLDTREQAALAFLVGTEVGRWPPSITVSLCGRHRHLLPQMSLQARIDPYPEGCE